MVSQKKIVVSLLTKEHEFQALQAEEAERAASRSGLAIEVVFANNNGTLQGEQLYRFIRAMEKDRPAAILVQTVTGEGLSKVARHAVEAGIGWLLLNRDVPYIDALRADHADLPIGIVTIDQLAIGRIQGRQLRRLLPGGGNILYVEGPPDTSAAQQRRAGFDGSIAGGSFNLQVLNGDWTEASGEKSVLSWLRLSSSQEFSVHGVAAQNDAMAVGARKAFAARRPELLTVPFTGCDGVRDRGQRLVDEHELAATVIVPSSAGPAVDLLAAHLGTHAAIPSRTILQPKPYPPEP